MTVFRHRLLGGRRLVALALIAAAPVVAPVPARGADVPDALTAAVTAAAAYGPAHGYQSAVAVYDRRRDRIVTAGATTRLFSTESVVKTMIAARLIVQGRMHGETARRAYAMITRSDDDIADSFYGSVGGDDLIFWVERHFGLPHLGTPPGRPNWWGNTHITAKGIVRFYARIARDPEVGSWLIDAMRHAQEYGADGTYQFFGLPSATAGAAVKQGWGLDQDDGGRSAQFNSTGFVAGTRYAVAILVRGPASRYGRAIGDAVTQTARRLLPGGSVPGGSVPGLPAGRDSGLAAGVGTLLARIARAVAPWFGPRRFRP